MSETPDWPAIMARLHDAAVEYVEDRGWALIPISITSKRPLIEWTHYQVSPPTIEEVEGWFEHGVETPSGDVVRYFGLGLLTGAISGVVVVDADNEEAAATIEAERLSTPHQAVTRRGRHHYFAHPQDGRRYGNKAGGYGIDWYDVRGLDFRGDGGFVVLPPSVAINPDGTVKHTYEWSLDLDWDDMRVWSGRPTTEAAGFVFDDLDLTTYRVPTVEGNLSVWERAQARIDDLGRRLIIGADSTDDWMIRYVGERIRNGADVEGAYADAILFHDTFFDRAFSPADPREVTWLRRKVASAAAMDRRNHPEDYDEEGNRREPPADEPEEAEDRRFAPLTAASIAEIESGAGIEWLLDPVVSPGTVTQVVGYNGHGKSLLVLGMCWALACGQPFGPFSVSHPASVLYFDYENPRYTLAHRMRTYMSMIGDPGDRLMLWNSNVMRSDRQQYPGSDLDLRSKEGRVAFAQWVEATRPDVVVVDTIRSAYSGLAENDADQWAQVNEMLAWTTSQKGRSGKPIAAMFLHHRNKPGQTGLGMEAGSTAQLTRVETQLVVTQVYLQKAEAKARGGLLDGDLTTASWTEAGKEVTPHGLLSQSLDEDERIRAMFQLSFGKKRTETDNHRTYYAGLARHLRTDSQRIVASQSVRQRVAELAKLGVDPITISRMMDVPLLQVQEWI